MDGGAWRATVHGIARLRYDLVNKPPYLNFFKVFLHIIFCCLTPLKALRSSVMYFCRALSASSSFTLSLNVTESKGLASKLLLSSLYMFSLGNVIHCPVLNYCCLYANDSLDVVQPRVYSIASDHIPNCLFDLLCYLWPVGQKCFSAYVSLWMQD